MGGLNRLENESKFEHIERLVDGKMVSKTINAEYEDLSELIFGEGNNYNSSEVRKRMYGMKYLFEVLNEEKYGGGVATRILSISDCHVPFQLPVETFRDYIGKADILQLNGDLLDCQSISIFPKTYRVSMIEEMVQGRQYFIDLINYIKPKKVVINYGNHEMRYQNYLSKQLDDDMIQLMPQTALDSICTDGFHHYDKRNKTKTWYEPITNVFPDIEIEYTENWWCKIGRTIFCHPLAFSTGIMKTAERAMSYFITVDRDFNSLVMAHTHQLGSYVRGDIYLYEQGTCCDVDKITYSDGRLYNPQHQGFLYICQDSNGDLIREKTKLVHIKKK